jgi:hypothetical protein
MQKSVMHPDFAAGRENPQRAQPRTHLHVTLLNLAPTAAASYSYSNSYSPLPIPTPMPIPNADFDLDPAALVIMRRAVPRQSRKRHFFICIYSHTCIYCPP